MYQNEASPLVDQIERASIDVEGIARFSKGIDLLKLKVLQRMAKEPKRLFSVIDFNDLGSPQTIRITLEKLVKSKSIKKLKTYPRFYHVIL